MSELVFSIALKSIDIKTISIWYFEANRNNCKLNFRDKIFLPYILFYPWSYNRTAYNCQSINVKNVSVCSFELDNK